MPAKPDRLGSPVFVPFLAAAATVVIVTAVEVDELCRTLDVARLRDLDVALLVRCVSEWAGLNVPELLPVLMSYPFSLDAGRALFDFAVLALTTKLLFSWLLAIPLVPLVLLLRRMWPRRATPRATVLVWGRLYPLALIVAFIVPTIVGASRASLSTTIGTSALLFGVLFVTLRSPERVQQVLRCAAVIGVALTVTGWAALAIVRVSSTTSGPPQPLAAPGQPNIILVSIDSLRRDHVHCYGYAPETSPTLDRLAREGTMFRTVVSPTSWTLPAHLTLLSSRPPEEHGVIANDMRLPSNVLLLSTVLWRAGYATAGFVSGPYLDAGYGFAQGFDLYDDYTVAKITREASHASITSPGLFGIVSRWLDGWDSAGRVRPFFIFLHMWDVHYDYMPPPPYDSMFDPDYRGSVTGKNYEFGTEVHLGMAARDLQHVIALYDGEIRFTDSYLGKIIDRLRDQQLLDDTIVVVTADHGDEFFEHGHKGHAQTLYDESVLVPLIIRFPRRVPSGWVVEPQVRLMDVGPTVLSLAGLSRPPDFGSSGLGGAPAPQDLTMWLAPDARAPLPALVAFGDLHNDLAPQPLASMRTDDSKFIRELRSQGAEELYDLKADPGEQQNMLAGDRTRETPLRERLAEWRDGWAGQPRLARPVELGEEHKQQLRALGYVQ